CSCPRLDTVSLQTPNDRSDQRLGAGYTKRKTLLGLGRVRYSLAASFGVAGTAFFAAICRTPVTNCRGDVAAIWRRRFNCEFRNASASESGPSAASRRGAEERPAWSAAT